MSRGRERSYLDTRSEVEMSRENEQLVFQDFFSPTPTKWLVLLLGRIVGPFGSFLSSTVFLFESIYVHSLFPTHNLM